MTETSPLPPRKKKVPPPPPPPKPPNAAQVAFAKFRAAAHVLFSTSEKKAENIPDETDALRRQNRLMSLVWWQGLSTLVLTLLMIFSYPVLQPYYKYRTLSPENEQTALIPLTRPNTTDRALLSWAINSITEVMTVGFGDFDKQVLKQRRRFTSNGWESFLKAMAKEEIRDAFKSRQLVLTTVPSDAPVITAQGPDPIDGEDYKWVVEMPIIMTYITNNDVKRQSRAVVRLEIVRVPSSESVRGIAIKNWRIGS